MKDKNKNNKDMDEPHEIVKRSPGRNFHKNNTFNYKHRGEPILDWTDFVQAKNPIKREITMNSTQKHNAEPLIDWRESKQEKNPIKREIKLNETKIKTRRRRTKVKLSQNKEDTPTKDKDIIEADKTKATKILEEIDDVSKRKMVKNSRNITMLELKNIESNDQNGTEARTNLMTQAIIRRPNGKKVLLQENAYSEPIHKDIKINIPGGFDRRAFKTNINFYDDLPDFKSKSYESFPSYYDSHIGYKKPKSSYYPSPYDSYKYKNYDSYDNFDSYPKYTPHSESYESFSKYKSPKSETIKDVMVDVMPDHDAQYEYVPMEKDEDGNGKIKQYSPSKFHKSHKDDYSSGYYPGRPVSPKYESNKYYGSGENHEDDFKLKHSGGYGYSSAPQSSYSYGKSKYRGNYPHTSNHYDDDYAGSQNIRDEDESYPKYEKVPREYDYDHRGEASEEYENQRGRKGYSKPLTLKVNLDEDEEEPEGEEYDSRDRSPGRIAARVTKVPKTLEEYHKLHRTWEKRPSKAKNSNREPIRRPEKQRPISRPRQSQSNYNRFPPSRSSVDKPHASYEFKSPNSHVAIDFVTPKTPAYDEESESFRDKSDENEDSHESGYRKPSSPIKISPEVDSVFDGHYGDDFKRKPTEKPYKITRLPGKPLYSEEEEEEDSREYSKLNISPKLRQREKADLYKKLRYEIENKKYKPGATELKQAEDIFSDIGLDFNTNTNKDNYRSNYGVKDKSKILIPKVGTNHDDDDEEEEEDEVKNYDKSPRKSWSFQIP